MLLQSRWKVTTWCQVINSCLSVVSIHLSANNNTLSGGGKDSLLKKKNVCKSTAFKTFHVMFIQVKISEKSIKSKKKKKN